MFDPRTWFKDQIGHQSIDLKEYLLSIALRFDPWPANHETMPTNGDKEQSKVRSLKNGKHILLHLSEMLADAWRQPYHPKVQSKYPKIAFCKVYKGAKGLEVSFASFYLSEVVTHNRFNWIKPTLKENFPKIYLISMMLVDLTNREEKSFCKIYLLV